MAQNDARLINCFSSVFPTLTAEEIQAADVARLAELDSLAGVTLVALIDDEFGADLNLDDLLELGNFQSVRRYLLDRDLLDVSVDRNK